MYQIRLYENGRYVSDIGGPIRGLSEAVKQIQAMTDGITRDELPNFVGCKWISGGRDCCLVAVNELGIPVASKNAENQ